MDEIEEKYERATDLLEDAWLHIDWDSIDTSRRRKIWSEFEGQVRALSRCYSRLEPFLDKLGRRFNTYVTKATTRDILKKSNQNSILEIYRKETQVPMLMLRLRREEARETYEEGKRVETEEQTELNFKK